jgi:hypothetical protein
MSCKRYFLLSSRRMGRNMLVEKGDTALRMSLKESITLLFLACATIIDALWTKIAEALHFGGKPWWWKIQALLGMFYFFDPPYRIIRRFKGQSHVHCGDLIYGETPLLTFRRIMRTLTLKGGETFFDLGCGRGLPCFYARYLLDMPSAGIDLVAEFVERAEKMKRILKLGRLAFTRGSFLEADLPAGAIFYLAGTTFDDSTVADLTERLVRIPGRITVISLSRELPSPRFKTVHCGQYKFSWGLSHVYIQQKDEPLTPP